MEQPNKKKLRILSFISWYIRFYHVSFLRSTCYGPKAIRNLDRSVLETINTISTSVWKIIKMFSLIFQNSRTILSDSSFLFQSVVRNS